MGLLSSFKNMLESRELKKYQKIADEVMAKDEEYRAMKDEDLRAMTGKFRERLASGESLEAVMPDAFAAVREASGRTIGMRHFPVQIMGGAILHDGNIAEMKTGEGKTLVATLAAYLNALTGKGVHVVTVNDYLASRDAEWMGPIYEYLGMSVGVIIHGMDQAQKKEAYGCDITYGTNNEFGFDYLRDNMVVSKDDLVMRELNYAIIDEVDSILIDEARTPLIISGSGSESTQLYQKADSFASSLKEGDYTIEEKEKSVTLTESGTEKAEKYFGVDNLSDFSSMDILHHINQALKARYIMKRDVDYVVSDGEVVIVDSFTGRLMPGRRYNEGLHQAIEAKERVKVAQESVTLATITFQNYFRLYSKICGMTGTAKTEENEFSEIYGMEVLCVPTNRPMIREDLNDSVYRTENAKFKAVVEEIRRRHATGQPVLVGTISIEKSEKLSTMLKRAGIPHKVLNAKKHKEEAEIIAQAGQMNAVTISTNMAGRGTDIVLGEGVRELGGLHIIGTERHESRRIDNQLRGRAGRQGDPGSSQFFISMEDDLMRMFGSERTMALTEKIGMDDETALEAGILSKGIENAQKTVEGRNYGIRKYVLQYDDVMNKHREVIYSQRRRVLEGEDVSGTIRDMIEEVTKKTVDTFTVFADPEEKWDLEKLSERFSSLYGVEVTFDEGTEPGEMYEKALKAMLEKKDLKEKEIGSEAMRDAERRILLRVVDSKWMDHIDAMDQLRAGIGLRAYGQSSPIQAYTQEGSDMFDAMNEAIIDETVRLIYNFRIVAVPVTPEVKIPDKSAGGPVTKTVNAAGGKIAKNAKCPCGSGKKYKQCCGKGLF